MAELWALEQATMTFADDAARDAALAGVLREGLLTYNLDTNRLEVYDGTDWVEPAPPAPPQNLVAVKSAIFTGVRVQSNVAPGANFAVNDLEITHALADENNKLIISAFFGQAANSLGRGNVGLAVHDGTDFIAIGNAAGSRTRVTAGGNIENTGSNIVASMPSVTFLHTPGAGSKTYTVRAFNIQSNPRTVFINRAESDSDSESFARAVSSLVIQEVRV